jgi:hypothetical protein
MAVTDSPGPGRVLVALTDGPLVAEPTWTRYDMLDGCRCYGFDCWSGRQSELDPTDTGNATVRFHDRVGTLDTDDLVGAQIMLQLYNPVTTEWQPRWRGHIDDVQHVPNADAESLWNVELKCVDIFDYLGGVRFLPGVMGDVGGRLDQVFYDNENVDDRMLALANDASLASSMCVFFTGNISVTETRYDPDDVILQAMRDAADAEFPGVANLYVDRYGRLAFHGRFARFDPEGTESGGANWDFVRWDAGTRSSVTTGIAQIREFAYNRPRARIINSYLAWPKNDETDSPFDRDLIPTLLSTDATSISAYGYRGREATDLIIRENINNSNTGADECALFGQFYTANYAQPRKAIQRVTFKALRPADARASATWALMCGVDISDAINLTVGEAGLTDEPYFVDGVAVTCTVLNKNYDFVTVTPNLTPASYYGTDVFS